jgi:hypothetical protein
MQKAVSTRNLSPGNSEAYSQRNITSALAHIIGGCSGYLSRMAAKASCKVGLGAIALGCVFLRFGFPYQQIGPVLVGIGAFNVMAAIGGLIDTLLSRVLSRGSRLEQRKD